jgi:hypothetical protein
MQDLLARAHLPAVKFSPRAFMGCGGWDLAQAPQTVAASMDSPYEEQIPGRAGLRRPRKTMGCGQGGFSSEPMELVEPEEAKLSCGGGGSEDFMEDEGKGPIETLKPSLSGPRVQLGCGDEPCEECKAKAAAGMGCTKCKRIRQRAMMNEQDAMHQLGQAAPSGLPDTSVLVVSGLAVAGLFYLATR